MPGGEFTSYDEQREHSMADEGGAWGARLETEDELPESARNFLSASPSTPPQVQARETLPLILGISTGLLIFALYSAVRHRQANA